MSQTLTSYFADKPRLFSATKHLEHNKKLRRAVATTIDRIHSSTAKVDLAQKVLAELSTDKSLEYFFTPEKIKSVAKENLIYQFLEVPITLACELFTGLKSKSTYEAELYWYRSSIKGIKLKHHSGAMGVHLSSPEDKFRVYVTDPTTEVCVVENIAPYLLVDKEVKDRNRLQTPRQITLVKLNEMEALLLFHSYGDEVQRRLVIPMEKCKS